MYQVRGLIGSGDVQVFEGEVLRAGSTPWSRVERNFHPSPVSSFDVSVGERLAVNSEFAIRNPVVIANSHRGPEVEEFDSLDLRLVNVLSQVQAGDRRRFLEAPTQTFLDSTDRR